MSKIFLPAISVLALLGASNIATAQPGWLKKPIENLGGALSDPGKAAREEAERIARQAREVRERADREAREAAARAAQAAQQASDAAKIEADRIARQAREARERADREAREAAARAARAAQEARDRVVREAARIDELRRQAQDTIKRFNELRRDAEKLRAEYRKYEELANVDSAQLRAEAYKQLQKSGAMGSNRQDVKDRLDRGLSLVLWAKEFDHVEEIKFATALSASAASGNPGPALAYVKKFAADTKATVLKNLKNAPKDAQRKVEREFEKLFVEALDKAVNKGKPLELRFEGVSVTVGLATYNHWCNVKYSFPELVKSSVVLGVQLYEVRMAKKEFRIPLPNTFQPYVRVAVKYSSK